MIIITLHVNSKHSLHKIANLHPLHFKSFCWWILSFNSQIFCRNFERYFSALYLYRHHVPWHICRHHRFFDVCCVYNGRFFYSYPLYLQYIMGYVYSLDFRSIVVVRTFTKKKPQKTANCRFQLRFGYSFNGKIANCILNILQSVAINISSKREFPLTSVQFSVCKKINYFISVHAI